MSTQLFKDIRFWILIAFLIRLVGITNPPLEAGHNWRQTTVTMVARNFSESDSNILHPQVDFAGEKTGITGMEFPVYNYLIYTANELFGYQHWYGRLINLIVSSIGIYFFFLLVHRYFNRDIAFWSSLILLFSVWFAFSRKIMPDTFSMSLVIASIYYATTYLRISGKWIHLGLYALLLLIGVLSKLPSGYILILFIPILYFERPPTRKVIVFVFTSSLIMLPVFWWYFIWVPYLVETYGFWHFFMGKNMVTGMKELIEHLPLTLSRFYDSALKIIGFAVFVLGAFQMFSRKDKRLQTIFFLGFGAFLVIMFKAGFTFSHHSYYVIPFVPIMALIAGSYISRIQYSFVRIFLALLIAIECIVSNLQDFRIPSRLETTYALEETLTKIGCQNELIFINSGDVPTPMYYAHRKGWIGYNGQIENSQFRDSLNSLGLKQIIILNEGFGTSTLLDLPILEKTDAFTIYSSH